MNGPRTSNYHLTAFGWPLHAIVDANILRKPVPALVETHLVLEHLKGGSENPSRFKAANVNKPAESSLPI